MCQLKQNNPKFLCVYKERLINKIEDMLLFSLNLLLIDNMIKI